MQIPPRKIATLPAARMAAEPRIHTGLLNRRAWLMRWRDRALSTRLARDALALVTSQGMGGPCDAAASRTLAWQAEWRGDFDEALDHAERARAMLCAASGDDHDTLRGDVQATLGAIHLARGRRDLARAALDEGFEAVAGRPPGATRVRLLCVRAAVLRHGRHAHAAASALLEASHIATGPDIPFVHYKFAQLFSAEPASDGALSHALRAVTGAQAHGNRVLLPYALEAVASCQRARGAPDRARAHLGEAKARAEADGDRHALCRILLQRARLDADRGHLRTALRTADRGLALARRMTHRPLERQFLHFIADIYESIDDTGAALCAYKRLHQLLADDHE